MCCEICLWNVFAKNISHLHAHYRNSMVRGRLNAGKTDKLARQTRKLEVNVLEKARIAGSYRRIRGLHLVREEIQIHRNSKDQTTCRRLIQKPFFHQKAKALPSFTEKIQNSRVYTRTNCKTNYKYILRATIIIFYMKRSHGDNLKVRSRTRKRKNKSAFAKY